MTPLALHAGIHQQSAVLPSGLPQLLALPCMDPVKPRAILDHTVGPPDCSKRVPQCPVLVCRPATGRRRSRDAWDDCESSSSHDSHEAAHSSPDVQAVRHLPSAESPAEDAARQLPAREVGQARSSLECSAAAAPAVQVSQCAEMVPQETKSRRHAPQAGSAQQRWWSSFPHSARKHDIRKHACQVPPLQSAARSRAQEES